MSTQFQIRSLGFDSSLTAQVFDEETPSPSSEYKSVRRGLRKTWRTFVASSTRWSDWLPGILVVAAALLLVPAIDRALFRTWRERGFSAARAALALGVAVYLRLILDRRAPRIGKLLLLFAVVYGVARRDLAPDAVWPSGVVDDLIAVTLASKAFLAMCSDDLIEEHALKAARRRAWSLRRRAIVES